MESQHWYIGLMSGTSLDGVDGVLVHLPPNSHSTMHLQASSFRPFSDALRASALALQTAGNNEIERECALAIALTKVYAECVQELTSALSHAHPSERVCAIGVHGQTIRHRPELGFTRQVNNPALLAERTGIDVIADFRSRDVAAGGQGAPLVPAFHRAVFGVLGECRVVVNIGGISNISILRADGTTQGFDTGPGNVLMDAWIAQHHKKHYDQDGSWAASGMLRPDLLAAFCAEKFLLLPPPKSTGRDLFHLPWLVEKLRAFPALCAADVQATLCRFTARSIVNAIKTYASDATSVFVCGGGALNPTLMAALVQELQQANLPASLQSTEVLGVAPMHVEALAFAWLAQRFCLRLPANVPAVTGAKGERILGALYPA